jgi:hypothetical protein
MKLRLLAAALTTAVSAGLASSAAADVNVLWYTGGIQTTVAPGNYQTTIDTLATPGSGDPSSATWNITFWSGGPMPVGTFNVLVVASNPGPWSPSPNYTALDAANPTLGDRLLVTGQDADFHFFPDPNGPGPANFNGPRGFLRDAINWAAGGTGMGLVDLSDNPFLTSSTNADLMGLGAATSVDQDTVNIPGAFASFPINSGLTSAGLSDWFTSAHYEWNSSDTSIWTGINVDGSGNFITLVTEGGAGGIVGGGAVPEPATWAMMLLGIGAVGAALRTIRRPVMATA